MGSQQTFDSFLLPLQALFGQLDELHDGPVPWHSSLVQLREEIIEAASELQEKVPGFVTFVAEQQMLTPERKDDLAQLQFSLGYLASTLRLSMARGWGHRIDPSTTPAEIVTEWGQHVHTVRHVAKKLESARAMLTESTTVTKAGVEEGTPPAVQAGSESGRKELKSEEDGPSSWREIQGQLLAKRERGEPFTSQRKLADELGCSDATIRKAIGCSKILQGWKARSEKPKAAPPAKDLDEKALDELPETRESSPDDVLPDDEVENVMAKLINQATDAERAVLNAKSPQERRELVRKYQEQLLDREPSPLSPDGKHPKLYKRA